MLGVIDDMYAYRTDKRGLPYGFLISQDTLYTLYSTYLLKSESRRLIHDVDSSSSSGIRGSVIYNMYGLSAAVL
jgi:hypothetical protein